MKLVPLKNTVICKQINKKTEIANVGGIEVQRQNVDLYEIVDLAIDDGIRFDFKVGDVVMSCSTGDELDIDGTIYFVFKHENIIGKIDKDINNG